MPRALAFALAVALAAASAPAWGDPPGRVGRVAAIEGEVRTVDGDGAWITLPRNRPLSTGDRVITDKDGRATIEIGSTTLRVGPYSDVPFAELDDQRVRVRFERGQAALRVRAADVLGEVSVETDEGTWVPRHPGLFRFDRLPGQVLAAQAWSGDLLLEAPDSSLPVEAGQRAEVWLEGDVTHYRMVPPPTDGFSDWVLVEDRLDDRYAAETARAASAAAASVPAEMTGAAELSRYGQWSDTPDDGPLWTPDGVAAGWAPYQDGSWAWVAPWGWTWVDNAPWGFAPFHYGHWTRHHGRWGWAPGRGPGRPIYQPAPHVPGVADGRPQRGIEPVRGRPRGAGRPGEGEGRHVVPGAPGAPGATPPPRPPAAPTDHGAFTRRPGSLTPTAPLGPMTLPPPPANPRASPAPPRPAPQTVAPVPAVPQAVSPVAPVAPVTPTRGGPATPFVPAPPRPVTPPAPVQRGDGPQR